MMPLASTRPMLCSSATTVGSREENGAEEIGTGEHFLGQTIHKISTK